MGTRPAGSTSSPGRRGAPSSCRTRWPPSWAAEPNACACGCVLDERAGVRADDEVVAALGRARRGSVRSPIRCVPASVSSTFTLRTTMLATIIARAAVQAMTKRRRKTRRGRGTQSHGATRIAVGARRILGAAAICPIPERGAGLASARCSSAACSLPCREPTRRPWSGTGPAPSSRSAPPMRSSRPPDPFAALDALAGGWWAGYARVRARSRRRARRPRAVAATDPRAGDPTSRSVRFAARAEIARRRLRRVVRDADRRAARSSARWPTRRPTAGRTREPPTGRAASTGATTSSACARSRSSSAPASATR